MTVGTSVWSAGEKGWAWECLQCLDTHTGLLSRDDAVRLSDAHSRKSHPAPPHECSLCGHVDPVPVPPLGPVPYLPPHSYCDDHQGDRISGPPCPNCRPLTETEKAAHKDGWEAAQRSKESP